MAETIMSPRGLFVHELKTLLWVERKLADEVLPELRELVHATDLKRDVEHHLEETRAHVRNLERVFGLINVKPEAEESETVKGLRREHDDGLKLLPDDDAPLRDLFHAGAIARTEHVEIAAYGNLIAMAELMGEKDVAIALRENLEQEESALRKAARAVPRLLAEAVR